ncbi:MAG: KpsF/GutQ family sugar-phosphate isomerase [Gemmatimonadetes bacterium]|nr:KpsF/GutQ family sugar-phosphate isomerase [Gemmatimonadota bacterium]
MDSHDRNELLDEARRVLKAEGKAIDGLIHRLGDNFVRAVDTLAAARGRVIVSGIGKSGIVGRKIAATFTSTGTPATYLHPVEGLHGDLGIVGRGDVAVLISKSGITSELAGLLDYLIRLGVPIIALTGDTGSPLGKAATVALDCSVEEEACPLDLAPTTSTTATMAMGDALAVVLLQKKGFQVEDFAQLHPGGSLGRKLTLRVEEVMVEEGYPSLGEDALMRDCIVPLAEMRGTVPIVDEAGKVVGVVTAGDLTRLMERNEGFLDVPVREVMTRTPKLARMGELASAAVHLMEKHRIMALPVVDDDQRLKGIVHLHDLMRSGVV